MINKRWKIDRGITLVALVITIIVLLIIAGIAIAQLTNSGLFEKANISKEKYKNAQDEEEDRLAKYGNKIDSYINGDRTTGTASNNYSLNEQVIGTWIDGKPLYQKVINATINSSSLYDIVDVSGLNVDKAISIHGFAIGTPDNVNYYHYPINGNGNSSWNYGITLFYKASNNYIRGEQNVQNSVDAYIVFQYTKTTDT